MGTETINFALKKPDYGEAGLTWYPLINATFDIIDAHLGKRPQEVKISGSSRDRRFLAGLAANGTLSTGAPSANNLRALPFATGKVITLDRIGINVTTLSAGNVRLGIYADDGNGYPGSLVLDAGAQSTGTTGVKELTISQALAANTLYWLAILGDAAPTIRTIPIAQCLPFLGLDSAYGTALGVGWVAALTYGALPATFTAGGSAIAADPVPAIAVRVA
jgi:hypothetical protein